MCFANTNYTPKLLPKSDPTKSCDDSHACEFRSYQKWGSSVHSENQKNAANKNSCDPVDKIQTLVSSHRKNQSALHVALKKWVKIWKSRAKEKFLQTRQPWKTTANWQASVVNTCRSKCFKRIEENIIARLVFVRECMLNFYCNALGTFA